MAISKIKIANEEKKNNQFGFIENKPVRVMENKPVSL